MDYYKCGKWWLLFFEMDFMISFPQNIITLQRRNFTNIFESIYHIYVIHIQLTKCQKLIRQACKASCTERFDIGTPNILQRGIFQIFLHEKFPYFPAPLIFLITSSVARFSEWCIRLTYLINLIYHYTCKK